MLKKIRLKNSTIILIGISFMLLGVSIGFYEYFIERKNQVFSNMNILLYETEIPENIIEENINSKVEEETQENNIKATNDETSNIIENKYDYIGILEIPRINLKRGFLSLDSIYNNVDYNVTIINGSDYPDIDKGNLILAAHSGNCSYCYFDDLYKLNKNDIAYVTYNNIKYEYKIVNIYEVEKDGTVAIYRDYDKKTLTLITCTRNSNTKQTVYILELI